MSSRRRNGQVGIVGRVLRPASLTLAALGALALAPAALGEAVTREATSGALAVSPDGVPRVAYVVGGDLLVAARTSGGAWQAQRAARLPGRNGFVPALAVGASGRAVALAEDATGRWLVLARETAGGWRSTRLVRTVAKGAMLGRAGVTLDAAGRPAAAYALRLGSKATFLRLVRFDSRGRASTRPVTRKGYPPSTFPPSVAPVLLRDGRIRVVELYGGPRLAAAIEWRREPDQWWGKFLYSSAIGTPFGGVAAAAASGVVYSAWTVLFPAFGESHLVLGMHGERARSAIVLRHAFLAGLALAPEGPELGANDWVELGDQAIYAGLVVDAAGAGVELDGRLAGLAADTAGARHVLLSGADGLSYYASPGRLTTRLTFSSAPAETGGIALTGRVDAAVGGVVSIFREAAGGRTLAATVSPAPDGTFAALDPSPAPETAYRAVYVDPITGMPFASLERPR